VALSFFCCGSAAATPGCCTRSESTSQPALALSEPYLEVGVPKGDPGPELQRLVVKGIDPASIEQRLVALVRGDEGGG